MSVAVDLAAGERTVWDADAPPFAAEERGRHPGSDDLRPDRGLLVVSRRPGRDSRPLLAGVGAWSSRPASWVRAGPDVGDVAAR